MIDLQYDGSVARLVLNRPEVRNALPIAGWEALAERIGSVGGSGAQVLVMSGAAGSFCAGADLAEFDRLRGDASERTRFRLAMRGAIDALRALPIATVARIEGPCFGAGVALAMGCDIRLAAAEAKFAITPARMAIGYPQEDVERLVSLVGPGWAARLLFTGDAIGAAQAEQIGLIEGLADETQTEKMVQSMLACDPGSIAMLKRGVGLGERLSRRRSARALPPERP
jgi:enoyl-CoA hydratase/carnithine racemase